MANVKPVEGMENVYTTAKSFHNLKFEEDASSIIPFAKSKADILIIVGGDDKILSDPERVVI